MIQTFELASPAGLRQHSSRSDSNITCDLWCPRSTLGQWADAIPRWLFMQRTAAAVKAFRRGVCEGGRRRVAQDSGVRKGNGDGTVPLISLGIHCRKGWRGRTRLNPSGFSVTTRELKHDPVPMYQDPRCCLPPLPPSLPRPLLARPSHACAHGACLHAELPRACRCLISKSEIVEWTCRASGRSRVLQGRFYVKCIVLVVLVLVTCASHALGWVQPFCCNIAVTPGSTSDHNG